MTFVVDHFQILNHFLDYTNICSRSFDKQCKAELDEMLTWRHQNCICFRCFEIEWNDSIFGQRSECRSKRLQRDENIFATWSSSVKQFLVAFNSICVCVKTRNFWDFNFTSSFEGWTFFFIEKYFYSFLETREAHGEIIEVLFDRCSCRRVDPFFLPDYSQLFIKKIHF